MKNPNLMYCDLHRNGHVQTGNAARYQSERTFDNTVTICPPVYVNDSMGRSANIDTLYRKAAGCNSALERQCVENQLRSHQYDSVQLSSQGLTSGGNPDTLRAVRSLIAAEHFLTPQYNIPDRMALYNQTLRDVQWAVLGEKVRKMKQYSGMD